MYRSLILLDAVFALMALVAAPVVGVRQSRRWLYFLAALVAARLTVAGLLLTGGLMLADSRLIAQVPLAVAPIAWAVWKPSRTAVHVGATGVLLSVWWLLVPFGPQDSVIVLSGSLTALAMVAGFSLAIERWRRSGSRVADLPWLAAFALLIPAVTLVIANQANASADGHHHAGAGQLSVETLTGPRDQTPDVRLTLTAARGSVQLASGSTVDPSRPMSRQS